MLEEAPIWYRAGSAVIALNAALLYMVLYGVSYSVPGSRGSKEGRVGVGRSIHWRFAGGIVMVVVVVMLWMGGGTRREIFVVPRIHPDKIVTPVASSARAHRRRLQ